MSSEAATGSADPGPRRERAAALREQGRSIRAIAQELGVSRSQVVRDLAEVSRDSEARVPEPPGGEVSQPSPARTIDELLLAGYQVVTTSGPDGLWKIDPPPAPR